MNSEFPELYTSHGSFIRYIVVFMLFAWLLSTVFLDLAEACWEPDFPVFHPRDSLNPPLVSQNSPAFTEMRTTDKFCQTSNEKPGDDDEKLTPLAIKLCQSIRDQPVRLVGRKEKLTHLVKFSPFSEYARNPGVLLMEMVEDVWIPFQEILDIVLPFRDKGHPVEDLYTGTPHKVDTPLPQWPPSKYAPNLEKNKDYPNEPSPMPKPGLFQAYIVQKRVAWIKETNLFRVPTNTVPLKHDWEEGLTDLNGETSKKGDLPAREGVFKVSNHPTHGCLGHSYNIYSIIDWDAGLINIIGVSGSSINVQWSTSDTENECFVHMDSRKART